MKAKIENVKKERIAVYFFVFLLFAFFYRKIPLIQDAWASQVYNSNGNFIDWISKCLPLYFTLNGRIIATIFVGFFERNEIVLDFANAIFITALIYLIENTATKRKNIFSTLLVLFLLLLVSANIRTEVYFYATMIYLMPTLWFFFFLFFVPKYLEDKNNKNFCILCILGILNSGWIEHCGFAYVLTIGLFWLIDLFKNKKINIKFTIFETLNGITFLLMILSPGMRLQRNLESTGNSVVTNIKLTLQAIAYEHKMLMLILIIVCGVYVRHYWKNRIAATIYQVVTLIYAILFSINLVKPYITIPVISDLFNLNCFRMGVGGTASSVIAVGIIVLLLIAIFLNEKREQLLFIFGAAIFSFMPTIFTPNFSYRTCFFGIILFIFLTANIFLSVCMEEKKEKIIAQIIVMVALAVQIDSYMILTANIDSTQKERVARIDMVKERQRMGEWDYNKTLILPRFSSNLLYADASPDIYYDPVHYKVFLQFYGLDPDTLVVFSNELDELRIETNTDEIKMEILQKGEMKQGEYTYVFYIMQGGQSIWSSGQIQSRIITTNMPKVDGQCYFKCDIVDKSGDIQEVYSAKLLPQV